MDSYDELQRARQPQKQLSKEFVRKWLISKGFQGKENQVIPAMSNSYIDLVSNRYIELYEKILGSKFEKANVENMDERISQNIDSYFKEI